MKERSKGEFLILDNLRETLARLPNDAEKETMIHNLDNIINYFQNLQERLKQLPSDQVQGKVLSSIGTLKNFLESARDNPSLSAAIGLSYSKGGSRRLRRETSPEMGEKLYNELKVLSTEQIQQRLLDYKAVSMDDLRSLAKYIGIKNIEKTKRIDLIDRIVKTGFANVRGYELLRSEEKM